MGLPSALAIIASMSARLISAFVIAGRAHVGAQQQVLLGLAGAAEATAASRREGKVAHGSLPAGSPAPGKPVLPQEALGRIFRCLTRWYAGSASGL